MNDKILQKNVIKLFCESCNFTTGNKYNYDKHLLTAKHLRMTNELQKNAKNATTFDCDCGKVYRFRQGLFNHKKKCENIRGLLKNELVIDIINENKEIKKENQEIKNLLLEQNKQVLEQNKHVIEQNKHVIELQNENKQIINKIAEITQNQLTVNGGVINNTTNNTTNNNQNFNLNFFLNETCKDAMNIKEFIENIKITFEELLTIGNSGFVNGISDIFIKQLQDLEIEKRPIHCTDAKREIIYFKEDNAWNKDKDNNKLKEVIETVENKNYHQLAKWCENNPDSRINNTSNNLLRDKIYLQTLQGDEKTREKIIKNISKEITINK
jgi:hypothetical protein